MQNEPKAASGLLRKALVATSGAVGGSFGLAALPIELPVSTIIMLRSIGDIARSEGEDLTIAQRLPLTAYRFSPWAGSRAKRM